MLMLCRDSYGEIRMEVMERREEISDQKKSGRGNEVMSLNCLGCVSWQGRAPMDSKANGGGGEEQRAAWAEWGLQFIIPLEP
jgi:hypothetical protein